jgi:hypothetical protein
MSELSKNQLVTRRGFLQRSADAAKLLGVGAALGARGKALAAKGAAANPWAYDDTIFRKTDPKLVRYRQVREFKSARPAPRCVALSKDENLFIGAGKFVTEYSLEGAGLNELALAGEVRCLAIASDGIIYVGERERVLVYDRKGRLQSEWPAPTGKPYFTGLAVNDTDLFVADAGNRVVLRYDRSGKLKTRIGARTAEKHTPGFIVPSPFFDVELAHDGLLRVTNPGRHQVEAWTVDGDLEFSWGKAGAAIENFCGCCNPINLALLSDGRAVTFEKGIPRVKVYSNEGAFDCVVAGAEAFEENAKLCGPNDCTVGGLDGAVDSKGRIYILDLVAANVRIMEHSG